MDKDGLRIYLDHDRINRVAQYQKMIKHFNQKIEKELSDAYKENGVKLLERREKERRSKDA